MKISKILSALIALQLSGTLAVIAQNGTMTPYSRYGYGILKDNATAAQRNMGGVGYAMISGRQINVMNPASYAAIDSLTFLFDMGIDFTTMWQNETVDGNKLSDKQSGGGLDYITMQFPIGKFMSGRPDLQRPVSRRQCRLSVRQYFQRQLCLHFVGLVDSLRTRIRGPRLAHGHRRAVRFQYLP